MATLKEETYERGGFTLNRSYWVDTSPEELQFSKGTRVWPAGEEENSYYELIETKPVNTPFYKEGGHVCKDRDGRSRIFSLDSLIVHPLQKKPKNKD
jgi:hypothetical protein